MADIRINALATTATTPASDDYLALDGAAQGTRKILATNIANNVTDVILGSSGPSVKSSLSARAPRQGLVFDGTAGATVSVPAFGTSDFSVAAIVNTDLSVNIEGIVGANGSSGFGLFVFNDGTLAVQYTGISTVGGSTSKITANKNSIVAYTRSGTTGTFYINGVSAGTITDSTNYTTAIGLVGNVAGLNIFKGTVAPLIYNRALSASEVVALYESGAPAGADYNSASNTVSVIPSAASTFTGGGWTNWFGSVAIGGGVGAFTASGSITGAGNYGAAYVSSFVLQPGKRYRLVADVNAISGGNIVIANSNGAAIATFATTTGAGQSLEFVAPIYSGGSVLGFGSSAASGTFTLDNVYLYPLGLLLAPDAAQAGGGLTWYDTSGNAANISWTSGVSWNVPSSSYWGGQLKLQSTTGTNGLRINNISSDTFGFFGGGNDGLPVFSSLNNATIGSATYGWLAFNSSVTGDFELYRRNNSTTNTAALIVARSTGNLLIGGTIDGGQKLQVSGTGFFSAASGSISNVLEIASNDQSGNRFRITNSGSGGKIWSLVGGNPGANNADFTIYDESNSVKALVLTAASGDATFAGTIAIGQYTTAGAPAYAKGKLYFDVTLNKLRVGGATGWETITSV